jgi:hypothetical protein
VVLVRLYDAAAVKISASVGDVKFISSLEAQDSDTMFRLLFA